MPLPTQTRWTERFLQRCVCTVLVAEKASTVREDILMCTGSSFQKRSNCVRGNGWHRAVSVLQVAVGMVRIVCAVFAADSVKQHMEISVHQQQNRNQTMRRRSRAVTVAMTSADEAGMTGPTGCGAEGAVPDRALAPFLSRISQRLSKVGGRVLGQQMLSIVGLGSRRFSGC